MRCFMRSLYLVSVILLGCAKPEVLPSSWTPSQPDRQGRPPVSVSWKQLEFADGTALLSLQVEKRIHLEQDLSVSLTVPKGATAEPEATWTIGASDTGNMTRTIRVRWTTLPTDDLLAVADSQGQSVGVHATAPYRFGRQQPSTPGAAVGEPVQVGNHGIGNPVDLTK